MILRMLNWLPRCRWFGHPIFLCDCGKGGGSSQTVVQTVIPPKSEEELGLLRKQNELLDIQISEVKRQNDALASVFPAQTELLKQQTNLAIQLVESQKRQVATEAELAPLQKQLVTEALEQLKETPAQKEIREVSEKRSLAILKGEAPPLAPGQQERIEKVFARAEEEAQASLRQFGEELAGARGLRLTDTPIGAELLEQGKDLASGLAAAKARTELDVGSAQQQFDETVAQFQQNLRQRAVENRLALIGRTASLPGLSPGGPMFGTGSAGSLFTAINPLIDTLARERFAGATRTESGRTRGPGFDFAQAGVTLGAAGLIGAGGFFSSRKYKRAIAPLNVDEHERALRRITETPIYRYRYKWEPDQGPPHIGPILETAPAEISDDGETVNLLDYAGLQHAAMKGLHKRVRREEAALHAITRAA